jgi:hypothetical protein
MWEDSALTVDNQGVAGTCNYTEGLAAAVGSEVLEWLEQPECCGW